jgi:gamma-glutamyltranspeptidase/glutathione hydrolase
MLRGFTAQAALDAPRFCISAGMPDPNDKDPAAFGVVNGDINFEDAIPMSTIQKLRGMAFCLFSILFLFLNESL